MLERFSRLPIESPKPIIWIVALLTLIATPALLNVEFATDVQAFLPQSEEVETYDKITDNFGRDSSVVNLYITPLGDGNVLTMANLQEVLYLHEESSKLVGVKDVISVAGFFDDALRDSGTTLQEINGEECLEFDDRNGDGNYDSGEICHYSNWDRVWDTIKPSNKETNFTMNDLDFVTDVLVNRDMNIDPFVYPEKNKAAPMANSTLVMVYLDPSLTTDEKKDLG